MLMPFCRTALFAAVAAVLLPSASAYAAENISEAGQDADGWYLFDFTVSGYEEINNMIEDVRDYAFEGTIATHQAVIATDAEAEQTQIGLSAVHGTKTSNASSIAVENSYSGSGSAKAKGYLELSKDKFPALSSSGNPWLIQSEDAKEGDWPIAVTIVPSFYYQKNFDIKLVSYGMEGTNAELENAGSISVRSNVSFELDAQTSFYLGSSTQTGVDNDLPTADEVSQLKQDVSWTITPAGEVTASIEASIIAVGMRAVSGSGQAASAVNSGSIVIEGSALFTGSVTAGLAEGSLSSTAVTGGDHTFTLTITDGNVTGNVTAEGDIYAAGLMGTADATSSEALRA